MSEPKKKRKETGNYIFPNIMAEFMKKVTLRIQYESSLMSLSIILVSLFSIGIFTIFFTDASTGVKIVTGINTVALFIFLSSNLVTSYQQYVQYLTMVGIIDEHNSKESMIDEEEIKEEVKEENVNEDKPIQII